MPAASTSRTSPRALLLLLVTLVVAASGLLAPAPAHAAAPELYWLWSTTGPASGGNQIGLQGSGFTGATGVLFGDNPGTNLVIASDTDLSVTVPAGTGEVSVRVTSPEGQSNAFTYRYQAAPTVTSVTPAWGPTGGGNTVDVAGTGFDGATAVRFGASPATSFTVYSSTRLTAVAPSGTGTVDVRVETGGGYSATGPATAYSYGAAPTPTVASATPASGPLAGGTTVTLAGTGFDSGQTSVTVGGLTVPADAVTVASSTSLSFQTPAHAAGDVQVGVISPGGASASSVVYTYDPVPKIAAVSPATGTYRGGSVVTITGAGFTGVLDVTFDGSSLTDLTVVDDSTITGVTPAHVVGDVDVVVAHPEGAATLTAGFAYAVVPPTITGLDPSVGPTTGYNEVQLTGVGFLETTEVWFGTEPANSFVVRSDTWLSARAPAGTLGPVDITVVTPDGTSATGYTYVEPTTLTGVSPAYGVAGDTVTLTGVGFLGTTRVRFGNRNASAFSIQSDTQLTATVPTNASGWVDVTVTSVGGTSARTEDTRFAFATTPTVTGLSPNEGPVTGGTWVTVTGSGFVPGHTSVTVRGVTVPAESVWLDSATSLSFETPVGEAGKAYVRVTTPGGTSSSPGQLFIYRPVLSATSLTPAVGPTAGGTTVTVAGTEFVVDETLVIVDGEVVPVDDVTVDSDTSLSFVAPAHAAGDVQVLVSTANDTTIPGLTFTYLDVPAVTSLSPAAGPVAGGTSVTITGTALTGATGVDFGAIPATSFTVDSDTQITAVAPAQAAGDVQVTVVTPGGTSATPAGTTYSYLVPPPPPPPIQSPTLTSLSPTSGPAAGGTTLTLTGTGFAAGDTTVTVDGTAVAATVLSSSSLTVTTPAHAPGVADVVVRTSGGTSAARSFRFVAAPVLSDLSPGSGPVAGGTSVTLTGTGFTGATQVSFGDDEATSYVVDSATQITAVTPAHAAGEVDVRVTTPDGTSRARTFTFVEDAPQAPAVTSVLPAAGPVAGGTRVELKGSGFTGATVVRFGSTPARFVVGSDSSLTVLAPAHAAGSVPVTVTTPAGTSDAGDGATFRYVAAPQVFGVSPAQGSRDGGTEIVVRGRGFTPGSAVLFGGRAGVEVSVVSRRRIVVTTPERHPGVVHVRVVTAYGTSAKVAADRYRFVR